MLDGLTDCIYLPKLRKSSYYILLLVHLDFLLLILTEMKLREETLGVVEDGIGCLTCSVVRSLAADNDKTWRIWLQPSHIQTIPCLTCDLTCHFWVHATARIQISQSSSSRTSLVRDPLTLSEGPCLTIQPPKPRND
jgi:hypothetical protein